MQTGQMYLWRFKKDGRVFRFGYVCKRDGGMVEIGGYNGASNGIWVRESEVEYENYHR